ncbi:MAG: ATP synthase F1 subunit epsilon [Paludibacteraceae bacterium]|nr:ATP synthase F1 subunit epsilon [Paludibacteraceae bacterium]MBR2493524.1 ATP synthase F1 subunit epsilon [Paludibacteraceae bacterium]MBR3871919.1 ATP synthase F1 subunit epsilon [Paludibacteraceae bacterium]MBR6686991.1 ATP synthase F1 subunit epsilon [Paludibacteraceae bacterium]
MNVSILSPLKTLFQGEATSVNLPGKIGAFTVLENHAPIVSTLDKGVITITNKEENTEIEIVSGFVEVHDNEITICVEQ